MWGELASEQNGKDVNGKFPKKRKKEKTTTVAFASQVPFLAPFHIPVLHCFTAISFCNLLCKI